MYLNIEFTSGSNPWIAFGDKEKLSNELRKWKRSYIVEEIMRDNCGVCYKATRRTEDTRFIAQLSKSEQKTIRDHIVYRLKRAGAYTKENLEDAMSARVCDVY